MLIVWFIVLLLGFVLFGYLVGLLNFDLSVVTAVITLLMNVGFEVCFWLLF